MAKITLQGYAKNLAKELEFQTYREVSAQIDRAVRRGIQGGLYDILGFSAPHGLPIRTGAMKLSMFHDVAKEYGIDVDTTVHDMDAFTKDSAVRRREKFLAPSHQVRIKVRRKQVHGVGFIESVFLEFPDNYLDMRDRFSFNDKNPQKETPYETHKAFVRSFKLGFKRAFAGKIKIGSNVARHYGDMDDAEEY